MTIETIMKTSPIVPVIAIEKIEDALPLAKALHKGGVNIMEITLRTDIGLEAIKLLRKEMPMMVIGAGTVCNQEEFHKAVEANAQFVFSPGISQELVDVSQETKIPFVPGVATASEVMLAQNNSLEYCKLFPATIAGGIPLLKAFQGPFSSMKFCPTGGVNLENLNDFLALKNVVCVGGTWIVAKELIQNKAFEQITQLCKEALAKIELKEEN